MNGDADQWDRRKSLQSASLAGTAGIVGLRAEPSLAEPPPETSRLRLVQRPVDCMAPLFVAQELFGSEGFTDVAYLKKKRPAPRTSRRWLRVKQM
jgi:hypothetical protein